MMEYRPLGPQVTPAPSVTITYSGQTARISARSLPSRRVLLAAAVGALLSDLFDGYALTDQFGSPGRYAIAGLGPSRLLLPDWAWLVLAGVSLGAGFWLDRVKRGRPRRQAYALRVLRIGVFALGAGVRALN